MQIAVIGASGRTGSQLVRVARERGHDVVAVSRDATAHRLEAFADDAGVRTETASVVSDEAMLTRAMTGCDAVLVILISARDLKATDLVRSLARAGEATNVKRFVFTAGEITVVPEMGETFTTRQKLVKMLAGAIMPFTPYSLSDMIEASRLVRAREDWSWTIVRAPTLVDGPPTGYRLGKLSEVTGAHKLPRADYAACLLDVIEDEATRDRMLTVLPAGA